MQIKVLLFAAVRDAAGNDTLTIEVSDSPTAADITESVGKALPSVANLMPACRIAVDSCYVDPEAIIPPRCEVALIPPVSGG